MAFRAATTHRQVGCPVAATGICPVAHGVQSHVVIGLRHNSDKTAAPSTARERIIAALVCGDQFAPCSTTLARHGSDDYGLILLARARADASLLLRLLKVVRIVRVVARGLIAGIFELL